MARGKHMTQHQKADIRVTHDSVSHIKGPFLDDTSDSGGSPTQNEVVKYFSRKLCHALICQLTVAPKYLYIGCRY